MSATNTSASPTVSNRYGFAAEGLRPAETTTPPSSCVIRTSAMRSPSRVTRQEVAGAAATSGAVDMTSVSAVATARASPERGIYAGRKTQEIHAEPGCRPKAGTRYLNRYLVPGSGGADACELFGGGDAGRDLRDAVVPHRSHALLARRRVDQVARRLLGGERLEPRAHLEELEHADSSLVAGVPAARAAVAAVEERPLELLDAVLGDVQRDELLTGRAVRLGAVRAQLAGEPLRQDGRDGRAGDERLDAHFVEARER